MKAKQKLQLRESWVGCVCLCFPFSIFHYHHRHHHRLSLSLSNMGSSNSRLESRPSRPPRVNGTNRSNVFSLICGGSSSRATHQVHHFQPKKAFIFYLIFTNTHFVFVFVFHQFLNLDIQDMAFWWFGFCSIGAKDRPHSSSPSRKLVLFKL